MTTTYPNGPTIAGMLFALLLGAGISFLITKAPVVPSAPDVHVSAAPPGACTYNFVRADGYQYVRPLMFTEPVCASSRFDGLRRGISMLVDSLRSTGTINSMSVYVRDFRKGEWTAYNGDERFDPGSLLKVPLLMCYLAMAEEDPAILKRKYRCEQPDYSVPQFSAFPDKVAEPGQDYTVEQLLELSIVHSDNRATVMLLRHMSSTRYVKFFTDLGLPPPDWGPAPYPMNAAQYATFLKALYNVSVLGPRASERALRLMTRSSFREGLVAGLPEGLEVAHKFGEAGNATERQLHESGLVYLNGHPYIITVMTRGRDTKELARAIAATARAVHMHMSGS